MERSWPVDQSVLARRLRPGPHWEPDCSSHVYPGNLRSAALEETRSIEYGNYPEMPEHYGVSLTEETSPGTDESPPPVETLTPRTSDVSSHESVVQSTTQTVFPRKTYPLGNRRHRDPSQ